MRKGKAKQSFVVRYALENSTNQHIASNAQKLYVYIHYYYYYYYAALDPTQSSLVFLEREKETSLFASVSFNIKFGRVQGRK